MTSKSMAPLPASTRIELVALSVSDIELSERFYARNLGLTPLERSERSVTLGTGLGRPLVELVHEPDGVEPGRRSPGLFHLAILLPDRIALGRSLSRLWQSGWQLSGAGDHLVSEALYLDDPEGNGIELYWDRPKDSWKVVDGMVQMDTLAVDIESLLEEGSKDLSPWDGIPEGSTMGHVHLKVSDLDAARDFYTEVIGFELVFSMPQANFLSTGAYHHHLGLNTWMSSGGPPPPPNALGLRNFTVMLPSAEEIGAVRGRLEHASIAYRSEGGGILLLDPSGNGLLIKSAPESLIGRTVE
ncbi:MAG: VOC family protein [Fimbriimonas sp.]|nr:VOC family protein [Fimbriimonas sp.]